MSDQFEFSQLAAHDLPAVRELAARAWWSHYPGIISDEQIRYMLEWMYSLEQLQDDLSRGVQFEGAYKQGVLIGFAAWESLDNAAAYLHKLYIDPDMLGSGLGSQLLARVKQNSKIPGNTELRLAVNKRNHRAIRAYERNGFKCLESVCNDIGRGYVMDDYVYGIKLGV